MERRYGHQLDSDAKSWIQSATYTKFCQIAKGLFADGQISWSRIVVLFMFAVKVVVNAVASNLGGLAGDVIRFAIKFILLQGIRKWILNHGGWMGVLHEYSAGSTNGGLIVFLIGLCLIVFAVRRMR